MKNQKQLSFLIISSLTFIIISGINNVNLNTPINDTINPIDDNLPQNDLKTSAPLDERTGYAIIVGISNYPGSSSDLAYCDDDAQDIRSMLINDYNFKNENIIYLQDSSATKNAISSALDLVASMVDSNDVFFFSYSGHGGFGSEYGPYSRVVQSPHNYPNNYDNTWSISHPGAAYMRVHFSRLHTESSNWDYLLCGDSDVASGFYYELFSGNYGYNFWSSYIPVDRYYMRLVSDASNTYYGFRVDQYEVIMDDGTHYLCSYDSIPDASSNNYIDSLLDAKLDSINCDEKYVVLDSCHSGGMIPEMQATGRYIMTASQADEYSLEDSARQNGCFTWNFLNSLTSATDSNGDGVISMEEIYDYTYTTTVSRSTSLGYVHHPQEYDGITGESVMQTTFGSLSITNSSNQLNYNFYLYGLGEIENLTLYTYYINATDVIQNTVDLLVTASSATGFELYSGMSLLSGASSISGYKLTANIQGNTLTTLNQVVSGDYDGDTIVDAEEIALGMSPSSIDSDSDGLNDTIEYFGDTNPILNDTDGDGISDGDEVLIYLSDPTSVDTDMDGLTDGFELLVLLTNLTNPDSDGDLMLDGYEYYNDLNYTIDDSSLDHDSDGLSNLLESQIGSQANNTDSDGDTIPDLYEYNNDLNLLLDDSNLDHDSDGLSNLIECQIDTQANNTDTDGDMMLDGYEYYNDLNYTIDDSSLDHDSDGLSNLLESQIGSQANNTDTDGDTIPDLYEYNNDLNLLLDDSNLDHDSDGLSNLIECQIDTQANNTDTDGDMMLDGYEYYNNLDYTTDDAGFDYDFDGLTNIQECGYNSDPHNPDTDGDELSDSLEIAFSTDILNPDSDGDGVFDGIEIQLGLDPLNPQSSLLTIFLNLGGLILLCISGAISTRTIINKSKNGKQKKKKSEFNIKGTPASTNGLNVETKIKPRPTPRPSYSYQPPYYQSNAYNARPIYQNNASAANLSSHQMKNFILDIVQNKLPPPASTYSVQGKKALVIALSALTFIEQGKLKETLNTIILALKMGVPEPYNSQFKKILMEMGGLNTGSSFGNTIKPNTPTYKTNIVNNQSSNRLKICRICGKNNDGVNKFCTGCGGML